MFGKLTFGFMGGFVVLMSLIKRCGSQPDIGFLDFLPSVWTLVLDSSLIDHLLFLTSTLDWTRAGSARAGLLLFVCLVVKKFSIVCRDYLLHVLGGPITNLHSVSVE